MEEQLKKDLQQINKEIAILKNHKYNLEQQIIDSSTNFIEKFKIWYDNDVEGHYDWWISKDEFPLLRKYMEESNLTDWARRGETIDLERLFGDEIMFLFLDEDAKEEFSEEEYVTSLAKYQPYMKEAMDKNMKSFKLDW